MPVTEPPRAVFFSYASEDVESAQRICEALRAAGIEVWFDKSELRGADAWDQSIRKQIKNCALFLPIIWYTTHIRREGYFRLEWKLAIDRCHLMDANLAFLLPVVIDDTRNDDERVPERFREVQWTRLPGGKTTPAFVERVQRLLSGDASSAIRPPSSGTLPSEISPLTWRSPKRAVTVRAQFNLGSALASYGEPDRAIELMQQVLVTEPLRAGAYKALATYLLALQRLDEAERAMNKALELQPASAPLRSWLTIVEVRRGNARAALEAAQQEPPGAFRDMSFAFARQIGDDRSAADSALRALIEKDADQSAYQIAEVYALRNDAKATFEWLDRAWVNRDQGIQYLLFDPFILRYKHDPRFAGFCRKVGLPLPGEATPHVST